MADTGRHYEAVTRKILENLRSELRITEVQGPTPYSGLSGTVWKIEASCYREETGALVLVECRQKAKRRVEQEEMAGFAYRVTDVGAGEGLMVTTVGYQEGAQKVAKHARIGTAILNAEATEESYILRLADQLFARLAETVGFGLIDEAAVKRACGNCRGDLDTNDGGQSFFCPRCDIAV